MAVWVTGILIIVYGINLGTTLSFATTDMDRLGILVTSVGVFVIVAAFRFK
jgi:hypothetical protein